MIAIYNKLFSGKSSYGDSPKNEMVIFYLQTLRMVSQCDAVHECDATMLP